MDARSEQVFEWQVYKILKLTPAAVSSLCAPSYCCDVICALVNPEPKLTRMSYARCLSANLILTLERSESQLTEHAAVCGVSSCWNKKNTSMTAKHKIPSVRHTDEMNTTLFQAWNHFPLPLSLCQSEITTLCGENKACVYFTVLCDSVAAPVELCWWKRNFFWQVVAKGDKRSRL